MRFTVTTASRTQRRNALAAPHPRRMLQVGLLLAAAGLMIWSMFLPYWALHLHAPQYPQGLHATVGLNGVTGDVQEIDTLNHYIGMMRLDEAAKLERALAVYFVPAFAVLALLTLWAEGLMAWLLALPAIIFPLGFGVDLQRWLFIAGHNLDPKAPLSQAIPPFTPTMLGEGKIAQFVTIGAFSAGYYAALLASALVLISLIIRPRGSQ